MLPWSKQCRMRGSLQLSLLTQKRYLLILVAVSLLLLEALSHFGLESCTQNLCSTIFCQLSSLLDCNSQRFLGMRGVKETMQLRFPSHTPLLVSPAAGTQNFRVSLYTASCCCYMAWFPPAFPCHITVRENSFSCGLMFPMLA